MPNGGPDCCGTCWFNRRNRGEAGYKHADDRSIEPYCEIRDVLIENPFYTYCANHPHRRPDRDPIPIGPITRPHGGYNPSYSREVWIPSPDTEEIRLHLLDLLGEIFTHVSKDLYPIGPDLGGVVIWQLGEFREKRAEDLMRWISENSPDPWKRAAQVALEQIGAED